MNRNILYFAFSQFIFLYFSENSQKILKKILRKFSVLFICINRVRDKVLKNNAKRNAADPKDRYNLYVNFLVSLYRDSRRIVPRPFIEAPAHLPRLSIEISLSSLVTFYLNFVNLNSKSR